MKTRSAFWDSPFLNVFLFSLFWAFQIFVSKIALGSGAKIITFTIQSSVVSLLVLGAYILPKRTKEVKLIPRSVLKWILLANVIHAGVGSFLSYAGISLTTAVNAGFLAKFALVTTTFFAWLILKERLTLSKLVSVAIMLFGVFLITTKGQWIAPHPGDLFILLACFAYSLGNVLVRKVIKGNNISGDVVSFLRPVAAIPALLLFVVLNPLYPEAIKDTFTANLFDFNHFYLVLGNGLFVALLTLFLNRTLKVASASYMTLMSTMTPIIVSVLALTFLNETVLPVQIVGAGLIIASGFATHYLRIDQH